MATPASSPNILPSPPRWQRVIVRALLGGAACGLVLTMGIASLYFYTQRPKGWNKTGIRAVNVKAEPITKLNDQLKDTSSGVFFSVDLENTTDEDITVPKSVTILQESKTSHALHGSFLEVSKDIFIPARHVVSGSLDAAGLCAPNYDPQTCFNSYFQDDDYIVLLDSQAKYEIRIPIPVLTLPPKGGRLAFP